MVFSAGAVLSFVACSGGDEPFEKRASYALGMDVGNSIKPFAPILDREALVEGLLDALSEQEPRLSPEEVRELVLELSAKAQEENARRRVEQAETNMREGEEFLAENKAKDGVVETASGLQYIVLEQGEGPSPVADDRVAVHYEGKLLDGKVFDSSYERGEPAEFVLSAVIAGWTEGVQLMKVGSKYRFFLPSDLAYGERGAGQDIGPNATLIFEVELISIEQIEQ
jgi:FKBP-type peptidyl-prolyl cis-trans isomerase